MPGIVSLELVKHKNYLLSDCYLPSANPYIFSDYLPFHIIPQILTNYNPFYIKFMSFIIYFLIIVVFSIVIYNFTQGRSNALIFAALAANASPTLFFYLSQPVYHNATILFTGLFILLFFKVGPMMIEYKLHSNTIFALILLILIVFSDSIILAWFVIPICLCHLMLYKTKNFKSHLLILFIFIFSVFTHIYKSNYLKNFLPGYVQIVSYPDIIGKDIPLFIKSMAELLGLSLNDITPLSTYMYLCILFVICCLVLLYYASINLLRNNYSQSVKYFIYYLIISACIIFLGYIGTTLCVNIESTRYLTFSALSIYLIFSLTHNKRNHMVTFSVLIILLFSSIGSYTWASSLSNQFNMQLWDVPNNEELQLIDFLQENNLTYGLGDYWDSNLITYLSNEKIIIRPYSTNTGEIDAFRWASCENWFENGSEVHHNYFIVTKENNLYLKNEEVDRILRGHGLPFGIIKFNNYYIYTFNNSISYEQFEKYIGKTGWHETENWGGIATRWMSDSGYLILYSDENRTAELNLEARSFYRPRTIEVYLNDHSLKRAEIPSEGFVMVNVPIDLIEGTNSIQLYMPEGCEMPYDIKELKNKDRRCLSVAVQNVTITYNNVTIQPW